MKAASDPKDIQEFQFKQSNISQILDAFTSIPTACSLLAADKRRGLLYAGQNNKIIILKPGEDSDPEWKIEFNVPLVVSKLTLNCDCTYLAVAHGPMVLIYDAEALTKNSLQLLHKVKISTLSGDILVYDLRWNPAVPRMLCTVASDYTIGSFKIKEKKKATTELDTFELKEKLNNEHINALCAAWSPKGKQIVVGCKNGSIVQLKPDLKIARIIPGPNPYIGEVISILWVSNYQFCAAYLGNEQGINVLVIDAPKGETNAVFTYYEDITYAITDSEGEGTIPRYYFDHVPEWGLIIAASSNSSEIAILGSTDKGVTWNQWQLVDSGRAELPLIHTTESYPVGLAIDKSPVRKLPWGADSTLPHPVPILHILATSGQLCSFHMVNLSPKCTSINSPPTEIIAIPPQTQSNISPEKSLIMNGAATSTPLVKQPENTLERSKPLSAGNILNKFIQKSSFTLPPTEKPQQEQKPEQISMGMKLEPTREIQPQEIAKPDIKLTSIRETIMQESVEPKPFVDDDAKDNHAYIEEHNLFEKELRKRLEPQTLEYDTEEERQKLVDTSIVIDQFLRELKETTNSLSSDIAYLKALLLQSFAWVEETKSKNAATNDFATRNCGDNNKMSDLQKLYYYTQTQLTQASKILDLEWSNHKSRETSRMKIPHLEFLYQNLILHSKIIQEEKSRMEHLKKRWKLITRNSSIFGLNHSLSNLTIASSKYSTILPRNTGIIEARCKAIASKTLNFTQEKQIKLREHLSASTPRIIRPVSSSNIQDRLEETLSSLTSPNTTSINIKNKVDQSVSKQNTITKQQNTYIDPLDSMASIVAGIGTSECTSESNNVSIQNKIQSKQPSFGITFPISGNKPVQAEKISSIPTTTGVPQSTKAKQDTIALNQMQLHVPAHTSSNLIKAFPKVDTTTFDTSVQKLEETAAQNPAIQSIWLHAIKTENNLFNGSSLKDALPPETSLEKIQTTPNTGVTLPMTTAVKTKAVSTFSFATPITIPAPIKSTTQSTFVVSQTTNAQTISFASKSSSNVITPFNLKMTSPATKSQTQDVLSLTGSFIGLQTSNQAPSISTNNSPSTDGKYNCKATFGRSDVNQILSPNESQISAQHNSVTIVEVPHTEATTSSLPTSAVQDLLASSATPLFNILNNTSNVSVFEEIANSTPTTSSMPLFGGFFTTSSTTANTTTTSATISPFQSTLSRPFEKGPIMLPTASSANAPTTTTSTTTTTTTAATTTTTTTATTTTATTTATTSTTTASTTTTTTTAITTTTVSTATPTNTTTNTSTPTNTIAAAAVAAAAAAAAATTIITATTTTTTTTIITATTTATLPTLTFGTVATSTVAPVFGKPSLTMNSQFPSTPVVPPTDDTFGKPATATPLFKPFENAQSTFMFGKTTKVLTNVSIFSGTNTNSIFGGNTQVSSSGSIFGGNTSSINTFGTPQTFVFDNNAQKSDSIFGSTSNTGSTSFFGGATNNVTPALSSEGSPSVFGDTATNTSPMGVEQLVLGAQPNAFGQTPSFNAKPIFGSAPTFGAPKPVFGTGFATTAFGVNTSPPAFGNPPTMGGSPAPIDNNMPKVFGNVSGGSSTFETLASQSGGLSFSSLAQKTTDVPKSPVFTSGSSFSTWR
ncbi:nuclear pore complex protein Nup214 [Bombus bifarius]|uniref:Nuclear pore complex protein Nup214 n=1 Tax=Bombus bifarius TaxID=103933 RepID=A0A6P8MDF0_9HYME|nr:nuclear pore complex protein Nup214 [Bombus bifarius]